MYATESLISEFNEIARQKLGKPCYDFISGGSGNESTLKSNCLQYDSYLIKPTHFTANSAVETDVVVGTTQYAAPIMVSPMALAKLCDISGEHGLYTVTRELGLNYIHSLMSSESINSVREQIGECLSYSWFQLYPLKDMKLTKKIVDNLHEAGCKAIVITADMPVMATRQRDIDNAFSLPSNINFENFTNELCEITPKMFNSRIFRGYIDWKYISYVQSLTNLPIYLKGLFDNNDAKDIIKNGINGIILSNHGGRQLDGTVYPTDLLYEMDNYVRKKLKIGIDGGIRNARDVLVSLAMRADFVLIGRPVYWAYASGGMSAVARLLTIFIDELKELMSLAGISSLKNIHTSGVKLRKKEGYKNGLY